jgi:hypothetical protein
MKKVETPQNLVDLLFLRKYTTNILLLLQRCQTLADTLDDTDGVEQFLKAENYVRDLRLRYTKAMPSEHIEGVEEEKKRRNY